MTVAFSVFGVSEQTHENPRRYSNKTYEVVVTNANKQQIVRSYSADP